MGRRDGPARHTSGALRRLSEAAPHSPEWEAALEAVEEIERTARLSAGDVARVAGPASEPVRVAAVGFAPGFAAAGPAAVATLTSSALTGSAVSGRPSGRPHVLRRIEQRLMTILAAASTAPALERPSDLPAVLPTLAELCPADAEHIVVGGCTDEFTCIAHPDQGRAEARAEGSCPRSGAWREKRLGDALVAPRTSLVSPVVRPLVAGAGQLTYLVLPLVAAGANHGAFVLERSGAGFGHEDVIVMTVYARLVAERLTSGIRARQLEQLLSSQRRLLEINERLLSDPDRFGLLDLIADSLAELVPYDNLTIYRADRDNVLLRPVMARDRFADLILASVNPADRGLTGWVFRHGTPERVHEAHLDPRGEQVPGTPLEPESVVVVPLRIGGVVVGTLNVGRMGHAESHFDDGEFELIKLFAGQASIALANVEAHESLWERAETDALTGLRNRGAFERDVERALADPSQSPVLLLMLDLDRFKTYNDEYGHPAGDRILRAVGSAVAAVVGRSGYRYGGDEFAIVVPNAADEDADALADRVRVGLASVSPIRDAPLTVSVGAAWFPADASTKDELVLAADARLYASKGDSRF